MAFRMVRVELTEPVSAVPLDDSEHGIGLVVTRRGRPVGFALHDLAAGAVVDGEALAKMASTASAHGVVVDELREELVGAPTSGGRPSVSIVICTHNRTDTLARALASIAEMRRTSPHATLVHEVVVVDNAPSNSATRETVARFDGVRYVLERKTGLDFARNAGWRAVTGAFVAYVDDDVVVDPCWLEGYARALRANPDAGALTGLILPFALRTEAQILFERRGGFRRGFVPLRWAGRRRADDPLYPLGAGIFGAGANMAFRRDVLESLGGFDEALDTGAPLPGGGDLDAFYRVLRAGHPLVYEPSFVVHHEHRESRAQLKRQYYTWGLGYYAFLGKVWHGERAQRRNVVKIGRWWLTYLVRLLLHGVRGSSPTPPDMVLSEIMGAIEGALGEYGRSQRRVRYIRSVQR